MIQTDGGDEMRSLVVVEDLDDGASALVENLMDFVEPRFGTDGVDEFSDEENAEKSHLGDVGSFETLMKFGDNIERHQRTFEPGRALNSKIGFLSFQNFFILFT